MRPVARNALIVVVLWLLTVAAALAGSVETYIQELKSSDPNVRAKAAYELGCT
jgi:hypothetical protein